MNTPSPEQTPTAPQQETTKSSENDQGKIRRKHGHFRRYNENGMTYNQELQNFNEETPVLDAVLGALRNYKHAEDVICLITELVDPMSDFEARDMPTKPTLQEERSPVKMKIWAEKLKRYMDREDLMRKNIHKLYGVILGQCTPALKSAVKGEKEYKAKAKIFDALWIMKIVKKITASLDIKANKALTLHEQVMSFFTIRQGFSELNDDYLLRFNSRFCNMEMAGGEHFMCSLQLLGKELAEANDDEIKEEAEKFKAMCFILRSDEGRYNDLLEGL